MKTLGSLHQIPPMETRHGFNENHRRHHMKGGIIVESGKSSSRARAFSRNRRLTGS